MKYMHVERIGKDEVDGILNGIVHIFPKLHGSNAYVLLEDGKIKCFSRNHEIKKIGSAEVSNQNFAKFYEYCQENLQTFFEHWPNYVLYGEFLIPHAGVNYKKEYQYKFYVFDVFSKTTNEFLDYFVYSVLLEIYGIEYIPVFGFIENPTIENIIEIAESNRYLLDDNQEFAEGVVIKNYSYKNRNNKVIWAKYVNEKFINNKGIKLQPIVKRAAEQDFVSEHINLLEIDKEKSKLIVEYGQWENRLIPILGQNVFDSFITDYSHLTEGLDASKLKKSIYTACAIKAKE
jgi:ATP-dependent RNA circularization protein (DNA/RNA ligase family)